MNYRNSLSILSPRINITYKCFLTSYCKYCYAKKELDKYKDDMTIEDFSKIIKWFKEAFKIKNIVLLGGESTVHPDLKIFSDLLNDYKINSFLFTNGCFNKDIQKIIKNSASFKTIIFHYEQSFFTNLKLKSLFLNNLKELTGKKIIFRYNINTPKFNFKNLIELSNKYNASIAYSFTTPTLNNHVEYFELKKIRELVFQLIDFIKEASENNIEIFNKRPLPLCIFNKEQMEYIKNNSYLRLICCENSISVNPDLSLYAAPTLTSIKTSPVKDKEDLIQKFKHLTQYIEKVKWEYPSLPDCKKCKFWIKKECQGGCTVYKLLDKK